MGRRCLAALAALALGAWGADARADHVADGHLVAVGPTSGVHGYPVWYRDAKGLTLELCYDHLDPLCGVPADDVPDPSAPVSFPDNFPEEAFWWSAEAELETSAGEARLVLALEAAWNQEVVVPGDQISFGRVRIRIDLNQPGIYTVTHPYGVDVFEVTATGRRAINATEDIGVAVGDFTGALRSRIGPFLVWNDELPAPPPGYVGDPDVLHPVTGSPFGEAQNVFRIEGPGVGTPGSPFLCTPGNLDCVETRLFSVMGKIATISGVDVARASYARGPDGAASLAVFATSNPGQTITVEGPGVEAEEPMEGEDGRYFAQLEVSGPIPTTIEVTNESDDPPSTKVAAVTDLVTILRAQYDPARHELAVEAASSDRLAPGPTLTAVGFGDLPAGVRVFSGVVAPPASITVVSSAGGSDTAPVAVTGAPFAPQPVVADAGPDQVVQMGSTVVLDGRGSTGSLVGASWRQIEGTPVVLSGASSLVAGFVAPSVAGTLRFELQVTGAGGPSTDTVAIEVVPAAAPVANAGPDQTVPVGSTVFLDGGASLHASTFAWQQVGGTPTVVLTGANTAVASFVFPAGASELVFELTVSSPAGSSSDIVTIRALAEPPPPPVANAGPDQLVPEGALVTLDGSGSANAVALAWEQISGTPTVPLAGANTEHPTFTFPPGATTLVFRLTAFGADGSTDIDDVAIAPLIVPAPVANAGPDRIVAPGSTVVLDGSASTDATAFSWRQIAGTPVVVLQDADSVQARFVFPPFAATLVFELTVTGPGGSDTDTVSIRATADALQVTRAEYRTESMRWRIRGTAIAPAPNEVRAFLSDGTTLIGAAPVGVDGSWEIEIDGSPVVPAPLERLVIRSSAGAELVGVPLQQRR